MNLLIDDAIFITYAIDNLINASVRVASLRSCGRRAELSHHRGRGKHGCWMTARWAHDECVWSRVHDECVWSRVHDECVWSRVVCRLSGKVPFEMTPKES